MQLAEKMHTDRSTIAKWETGAAMPSAAKLPLLAEVLGCTIDELFGRGTGQEEDGAEQSSTDEKAALESGETTINAVRQRYDLSPIKGGDQRLKKLY